ncbi:isoleucine--tRNA ligase [Ichthyobacterium seriolicida]|uniref:Isoleucine--tRNA ligase n=1 Tax=Ichthyobacterium seriolicida TaxID=242600 RepID=A0A1J1DYH8_9FLAO|nr:isoleucine--tRNA ligase [Ichthyobacterium seriolicida]BAV94962.1 isoleucyl-tRNA synthetase [Ichthyobacterium seriolicida]
MCKKFTEYDGLELSETADRILKEWEDDQIFLKSISSRQGAIPFIFYEGPPSANGQPGIHHVMSRTIKDIFCRYKTLQGFQVKRKAGWDTHGLPVELSVEKDLGITKRDIGEKISVDEYNQTCKKTVMRYTDIWDDLTKKIGFWLDMTSPYITYESKYMESVWWLLSNMYKKGLLYKGYTVQPYSPKAGTGLSSHELNQPGCYRDITDTTVTAQFKAKKNTLSPVFKNISGDIYFLAWTTTPWTLPSNTALVVGKNIEYLLVKTFNQYTSEEINVIISEKLLPKQFSNKYSEVDSIDLVIKGSEKIPYFIISKFKGSDILGVQYEQLLPYKQPFENADRAFVVISGDFVSTEEGTGIVHAAPTFGADDAKVTKEAGVPSMLVLDDDNKPVPLVDLQGKFIDGMGELSNKFVKNEYYDADSVPEKSVDVEIAIKLKIENKAFKVEKYVHNYPHCWRTDKPILYYPLDSWFVRSTQVKDRLIELNKTINWKPATTGEKRFERWLENINDWNLSRSRYWGIPIPIWRTEDGREEKVIGSIEELKQEIDKSVEVNFMDKNPFENFVVGDMSDENYQNIDLHKNYVDEIILVSKEGERMKRESDLIDVWFDSGSMPYAQWHYPFENKDLIDENKFFPADFIAEGVDQTRGWFFTLHAIAVMNFDSVAFKNVISNGLVLDSEGKKMSKRLGNTINPLETLKKYGPDAVRWYMIYNSSPWDSLRFDLEGVDIIRRKFFGTLHNTYSFFALYANIDGFRYEQEATNINSRTELDRWILSELNSLIIEVEEGYDNYEPTLVARKITNFVTEHLSNWFVRLNRRRFWKGEYNEDKIYAYQTLYECLITIAKISSPIAPFFMDRLYKDLNKVSSLEEFESVHIADFPKCDRSVIDLELQEKMSMSQEISSMVLSLRKKEQIKVRQPLQKMIVIVADEKIKDKIRVVSDIIKSEVNVKEVDIEISSESSSVLAKDIKANFKVLGPKYGDKMGLISNAVKQFSQDQILKIENNGSINISLDGDDIEIRSEEVVITSRDIKGWTVTSTNRFTVALDINTNKGLIEEGIARELVNRIQNIRKDNNCEVTDKIDVLIEDNEKISEAIINNKSYICRETLALSIETVSNMEGGEPVEFDNIKTSIKIIKK